MTWARVSRISNRIRDGDSDVVSPRRGFLRLIGSTEAYYCRLHRQQPNFRYIARALPGGGISARQFELPDSSFRRVAIRSSTLVRTSSGASSRTTWTRNFSR